MQPDTQISGSNHLEPRVGRSVSIEQAAQLLGVSRRTVYNRIRDGRLRTIRTLGGSQRVLMTSLDEIRRPALTRVEGSVLSRVEGSALRRVERPALRVEGSSDGEVERAALREAGSAPVVVAPTLEPIR